MKLQRWMAAAVVLVMGAASDVRAATIGIGDFVNPTIIDFNDVPAGTAVGAFYAADGVGFQHLCSGTIIPDTAVNFTDALVPCEGTNSPPNPDPYPYALAGFFTTPVDRAGMMLRSHDLDDVVIAAYLDTVLIGFHLFTTGSTAIFAGVTFNTPFNLLVIDAIGVPNDAALGALVIDDLRFEVDALAAVPEPASLLLFGTGGLAVLIAVRRRRTT